jgi:hypothetical protein
MASISDRTVKFLDGKEPGGPFGSLGREFAFGTLIKDYETRIVALENEVGTLGTITVDTIAEYTSAAGVTIDGLLIKDERIQATGSGIATGDAGVTLKDNLANAWDFKEATNAYLTFTTTNDAERVTLGKLLSLPVQTIDMADAQVALVYGTAGAGQVKLTGSILYVDANSGTNEDLLLPAEATSTGVVLIIVNTGGEDIIVKEDGDSTTICTVSTTECAVVVCNGTAWRGGVITVT